MTFRQKILKAVYPFFAKLAGMGARDTTVLRNRTGQMPPESIYDLRVTLNTGEVVSLSQYRGRKFLIVNTASDCGYTGQYAELQDLHERYPQLGVIAFPANDFKGQESR
ncbi:MAG TPA: glutathione peroxidase, partial [Chitinophagaceae bacterium]